VTDPIPTNEPMTPMFIERRMVVLINSLTRSQKALADARDVEVAAKHRYEKLHRRVLLSKDCPKVSRGGVTTAERDAWVDERCAAEELDYDLAVATREAASDHLRTLRDQAVLVSALAKSVGMAYATAGTGER
jgi:hypothetical protein